MSKNAANKSKLAEERKRDKQERDEHLEDMKTLMKTPVGRRILHKFLKECRTFQSVWQPSAAIHRDAGKQELGHKILTDMVEADRKLAAAMVAEAYEIELEGDNNERT